MSGSIGEDGGLVALFLLESCRVSNLRFLLSSLFFTSCAGIIGQKNESGDVSSLLFFYMHVGIYEIILI